MTASPLPIGIDAMLVSVYSDSGRTRPFASPGKPSPVGEPNPKARRYASNRSFPSFRAIWIVPTFDDRRTMSRTGIDDGCVASSL